VTLQKQGKPEAAIEHFQQALMIKPNDAEAHYNLGVILGKQGKLEAAIDHFQQTLMIKPDYAQARNNLGSAFYKQGKLEAASEQYQRALQIKPDYVQASNALKITTRVLMQGRQGAALTLQGRFGEAVRCLERVLAICPENADAQNNLAWILATAPDAALRDGPRAVELATAANRSSGGGNASFLDTLAAACAEAGRYPEAVDAARRALDMAAGQQVVAGRISARLRLYESGLPYHEPGKVSRHDQP
jgi:tetratricopeptide (TPR) repeat protein